MQECNSSVMLTSSSKNRDVAASKLHELARFVERPKTGNYCAYIDEQEFLQFILLYFRVCPVEAEQDLVVQL